MPDVAGPFDGKTWAQAQWFRDAWARSHSGVFGTSFGDPDAGDLRLFVNGLTVSLALGRAHVRGAGYERTGTEWSYTVPANTAAQPRVDRLVLRRDLAGQTVGPIVLQGTPAASPVAPTPTQVENGVWDLPLYRFTVPANSGAPVTGVVDERAPGAEPRNWGVVPGTVLPTIAGGAAPGDVCYVRLWRSWAMFHPPIADTNGGDFTLTNAGAWRQIGVAQADSQGEMDAWLAALVAAGGSLHNGFLIFDNTADRLYASPGGTTLRLVGGRPGATLTGGNAFVPAANWSTGATQEVQNLGNGLARIFVEVTRTTSALTVPADGNVTNIAIGSVPPGWEAGGTVGLPSGPTGRMVGGYTLASSRVINLSQVGGTGDLAVGQTIGVAGVYPLADPTTAQ
jgi:hypothetical protein